MEYTSYDYASLGLCLLIALATTLAARRWGPLAALAVWVVAGVAAAAHAVAIVWGDEMLREYAAWRFALGGASAFVVPTAGALLLALLPVVRRRLAAAPHALVALALTVAMFVGGRALLLRGDLVVTSCDGDCDGHFVDRLPAEREAHRRALAPCDAMPALPDESESWTSRAVRPSVVRGVWSTLRLPASMQDDRDVPDTLEIQEWAEAAASGADLTFQRNDSASISTSFGLGPGDGTPLTSEGECRATVAGRVVGVRRYHWTQAPPDGGAPATVFAATTDIPLVGDAELGVGLSAPTAARRDSLLAALLAMTLAGPR